MKNLLQLKQIELGFGHPLLLDGIDLTIHQGERIALVGRNGCGKSTLLKVISGEQAVDDGQRIVDSHLTIARLEQDPPVSDNESVFDFVAAAMATAGELLQRYFQLLQAVEADPSEASLTALEKVQQALEDKGAWQFEQRITQTLTLLELDGSLLLQGLSGGLRRKAALARALVVEPDLLLLDEPTNHLDIRMIAWLEKLLIDFKGALVFISHDRAFIRKLATRIVDIDRGQASSYPGNYLQYLRKKAEDLAVEATQQALFDKKLSQEETWIRQGIKARRTRNEGRVRALKAMRQERAQRRMRQGSANLRANQGLSSGKLVAECRQVSHGFNDKDVIRNFDFTLMRGDKVALIGPNGVGKSTLIKILLGELGPNSGSVRLGTNLEVAYFDQHRQQLDLDKPIVDVVADGKRDVLVNGKTRHVTGYLQDFLFTPDRLHVPVSALSGGEKNRLLLAKLLLKPSNLLVLDEPTNDLDIETLELLEELLSDYPGTLILVSHDRDFVDNIVTSSLSFEGNGRIQEFVGGYGDIQQWHDTIKAETSKEPKPKDESPSNGTSPRKSKKLSYKHQRELEQLPGQIETLEQEVEQLQQEVNHPDFFKKDATLTQDTLGKLTELQQQLESDYARWDELESMSQS